MAFSHRLIFFFLFLGFFWASLFGVALFPTFSFWYERDLTCDEMRVVRTMLYKERDGLLARGGFLEPWEPPDEARGCYESGAGSRFLQAERFSSPMPLGQRYYRFWQENIAQELERLDRHRPYLSMPGWDTLLLYPFWRASQVVASERADRLYIGVWVLRVVSALSTALALWLLCLWISREVGAFSGVFVGLGMILSPICAVLLFTIGRHPLYKPFFLFVPFLAVAFFMQSRWRKRLSALQGLVVVALLAGTGVLTKVLFGLGYDFLAPVMVSATIPLFWYAVRERWHWLQFARWFGICSAAIVAAFVLAFLAHAWQARAIGEDFFSHAKNRVLVRSSRHTAEGRPLECSLTARYTRTAAERTPSWAACENPFRLLLLSFLYQLPLLAGLLACFASRAVRSDLARKIDQEPQRRLYYAVLVSVAIAGVSAASQPLLMTQATKIHYWLKIGCWLLMFRPFVLLTLALLLEPVLLRWSVRAVSLWQKNARNLRNNGI